MNSGCRSDDKPKLSSYNLRNWSLVKKGCLRASRAIILIDGSNLRRPCKRSIRSPAEWSTCCITKFCTKAQRIYIRFWWIKNKCKRIIPIINLPGDEAASSQILCSLGKWHLQASLIYPSLHISLHVDYPNKKGISQLPIIWWHRHTKIALTPLYLTFVMVMDPILFPSWPGALNFHVSGIKLHPAKPPHMNTWHLVQFPSRWKHLTSKTNRLMKKIRS